MTKDRLPDASDSVRIAKVLDVSVEYLVTGAASFSVSAMGRLLLRPLCHAWPVAGITHELSQESHTGCRGSHTRAVAGVTHELSRESHMDCHGSHA